MDRLTVLYDPTCPLCVATSHWLRRQESFVELELLPSGLARAKARFPQLSAEETRGHLIVIEDDRRVYRDDRAFVMCLWALRRYRAWALRLGREDRLPLARRFFQSLSKHRHRISSALGMTERETEEVG